MTQTQHWGKVIDFEDDNELPDISKLMERSMENFEIGTENGDETKIDKTEEQIHQLLIPSMDPLMAYTISLHKYYSNLVDKEQNPQLNLDEAIPPIPPIPEEIKKYEKNTFCFNTQEITPLLTENDVDVPELSAAVLRKVLIKCVAIILSHTGFESTNQSILDFMTDLLEEFLNKISLKLRIAHDDEQKGNCSDFPNIIEKVLVDIGMDGVSGLHDYYQTRVVKYIFTLHKRCQNLVEYLSKPKDRSSANIRTVKEENMEQEGSTVLYVTEDSTVLHVTGNESLSTLPNIESCFQLLDSLEARKQNLDMAEEESMS